MELCLLYLRRDVSNDFVATDFDLPHGFREIVRPDSQDFESQDLQIRVKSDADRILIIFEDDPLGVGGNGLSRFTRSDIHLPYAVYAEM